jgi:hypothetical protein
MTVRKSGTPIQNNLMDLHSLFSFINPGMLGSATQFRRDFVLPIERDGDAATRSRLRRLIAPFVLRRLKSEVLDDPGPCSTAGCVRGRWRFQQRRSLTHERRIHFKLSF